MSAKFWNKTTYLATRICSAVPSEAKKIPPGQTDFVEVTLTCHVQVASPGFLHSAIQLTGLSALFRVPPSRCWFSCLHRPVAPANVISSEALVSAPIIRRADYLSGRDEKSVRELSVLVGALKNARSRLMGVKRVRDPVLSDSYYTDVHGKCWRESDGE